ncbi:MAG: hypothetical protein GXP33_10770 [Spirochaetes bacterium]|nr:hypothetical protein [Spirochaetota bacterium]
MITFFAVFVILHGLAHLWYVTLSLKLIAYKPEMGWSGESWLLTGMLGDGGARTIASILYTLASLGLVAAGTGMLMGQQWFRPAVIWSAVLSITAIVLFWDGSASQIIEKGLLGLVINGLLIISSGIFAWPLSSP